MLCYGATPSICWFAIRSLRAASSDRLLVTIRNEPQASASTTYHSVTRASDGYFGSMG